MKGSGTVVLTNPMREASDEGGGGARAGASSTPPGSSACRRRRSLEEIVLKDCHLGKSGGACLCPLFENLAVGERSIRVVNLKGDNGLGPSRLRAIEDLKRKQHAADREQCQGLHKSAVLLNPRCMYS